MFRRGIAYLTRRTPVFPGKKLIIRLIDCLIARRESYIEATVDGVGYSLSTEDLISRAVLYQGAYQPDVLKVCDRIMAKRDRGVLWDVGANIGAMSLPLLKKHTSWRSICFEPAPSVVAALSRNRALNPELADRLTIVCAPLMERSGLTEFYSSCEPHNWGVGRPGKSHNTVDRPVYIGGYSGDGIVEETRLPPPDFVKLDVEGFEYEALMGMRGQIQEADLIALVFELSRYRYVAREDVAASDVLELLRSLGLSLYKVGAGGMIRSLGSESVYGDLVATNYDLS